MMNARPAALPRHLDTAQAEVQARDSEAGGRREGKVLLLELAERTSAKSTRYLSGWLGKARLHPLQLPGARLALRGAALRAGLAEPAWEGGGAIVIEPEKAQLELPKDPR
jgi:hypothetical protein